jgi:hypothetical protein
MIRIIGLGSPSGEPLTDSYVEMPAADVGYDATREQLAFGGLGRATSE